MKKISIQTIGIIGLGLIGTSIGMALKKSDAALRIKGLTRSKINRKLALEKQAVNACVATVSELIADTDLVILATPIHTILTLLSRIATLAKTPLLITDTGSTKEQIIKVAVQLPTHISFVGGHPLAGKEVSGAQHADANLFVGKPWILTPTTKTRRAELTELCALITTIGAKPRRLSAVDHDRLVGTISHLPFLVSTLLMETIIMQRNWPKTRVLAGNGFRDVTRLSGGDPIMHTDILRTNRSAILTDLSHFEKGVRTLKHDLITQRWSSIRDRLTAIQKNRLDWERSHV